jgi:ATP-dependent Zn protease
MIDVSTRRFRDESENMNARSEAATHAELERCMFRTRDILLKNRAFLERAAEALLEKETLLASDIRAIRESVTITEAAG